MLRDDVMARPARPALACSSTLAMTAVRNTTLSPISSSRRLSHLLACTPNALSGSHLVPSPCLNHACQDALRSCGHDLGQKALLSSNDLEWFTVDSGALDHHSPCMLSPFRPNFKRGLMEVASHHLKSGSRSRSLSGAHSMIWGKAPRHHDSSGRRYSVLPLPFPGMSTVSLHNESQSGQV